MITNSDYFQRLKLASVKVTEVLTSKGVSADKLCFGGGGQDSGEEAKDSNRS